MIFLLSLALAAEPAPPVTFADLVAQVGAHASSTTGCLLQPGPAGVAMVGRFQPGEATLTPPPADWDAILARSSSAAVVTPIGQIGPESASLRFTSLVPVPRAMGQAMLPVLVFTDEATWFTVVPAPEMFLTASAQRLKPEDFERLRRDVIGKAKGVVITAEAGVPMTKLVADLGALADFRGTVILATAWSGAPAQRAPAVGYDLDDPGVCVGGITDVPKGQSPGQLSRALMFSLPSRLTEAAAPCATKLNPDQGGEVQVALRLGQSGQVTEACVEHDTTHDPVLRTCVLRAVKASTFDPPVGGTFLNLSSRVDLVPPGVVQRAICAP